MAAFGGGGGGATSSGGGGGACTAGGGGGGVSGRCRGSGGGAVGIECCKDPFTAGSSIMTRRMATERR